MVNKKPTVIANQIASRQAELDAEIAKLKAQKAEIEAQVVNDSMVQLVNKLANAKTEKQVTDAQEELYPVAKSFCNQIERARRLRAKQNGETEESEENSS